METFNWKFNPSKMETNELPEEVKRKIEEKGNAIKLGLRELGYPDDVIEIMIDLVSDCSQFGYRLALQSKEEQLRAKDEEVAKLKTVMIAAAEEIHAHWQAHCDAEGYGPANLMHRLEKGIPSQYGYTAGAFMRQKELIDGQLVRINSLTSENKGLKEEIAYLKTVKRMNINAITEENERLKEALRNIQLEAIGVGDYAISPESHELIDSLLTPEKETCNHPATDKGPSGDIYCVVCLKSLEILRPDKTDLSQSTDKP